MKKIGFIFTMAILLILFIFYAISRSYNESNLNNYNGLNTNNNDTLEFSSGKDFELLKITSSTPPDYCVLILSSTNVPLAKGRIFFEHSEKSLIEALKMAYLNPDKPNWSIDLYHPNNFSQSYGKLEINQDVNCYNGGLTMEIIESKPPYYFIAIRFADKRVSLLGFIYYEKTLDINDFDFENNQTIYMKNSDKLELLSCESTTFDCKEKLYLNPYLYIN